MGEDVGVSEADFTWRDGERVIHFRAGVVSDSPEILAQHGGFERYELLTTERAMGAAPLSLAEDAACFHHVPPGPVNEVSARLLEEVGEGPLVALGGGRVIDVAKAIAAVIGIRVAALPTTLSGAEMTRIHRLPSGHGPKAGLVRPELVLADPPLMTSLPEGPLRASAMNALAHGADCLYVPGANPVSELTALRGARLIARAMGAERTERDPAELALGSILCAYALDSAGLGLHHVVCQSLVRVLRIPHAETNATMLPLTMAALVPRAGKQMTALARALGSNRAGLQKRLTELGGGPRRLRDLQPDEQLFGEAVKAILARPELARVPDPPDEAEIRELIARAW